MKGREKQEYYSGIWCIRLEPGNSTEIKDEIVTEAAVSIFINGRQAAAAVASPGMLEEFAAGFLLTEGIVSSPEEIESVMVEGNKVSVITLNPRKTLFTKKTVLSGCGGTANIIDYSRLPSTPKGGIFSQQRLANAVSLIESYIRTENTGEIYYAGIFASTGNVAFAGDIGRDNALDKVLGAAFLKGTDFSGCFVVVTGRISSEMVRKCLYAQVPFIISSGIPTSLAYEIALKTNVTLVGGVGPLGMNVYSGEQRVEGVSR